MKNVSPYNWLKKLKKITDKERYEITAEENPMPCSKDHFGKPTVNARYTRQVETTTNQGGLLPSGFDKNTGRQAVSCTLVNSMSVQGSHVHSQMWTSSSPSLKGCVICFDTISQGVYPYEGHSRDMRQDFWRGCTHTVKQNVRGAVERDKVYLSSKGYSYFPMSKSQFITLVLCSIFYSQIVDRVVW